MKVFSLLIALFFNVFLLQAQRVHVGVAGGLANYSGDLLDKLYPKRLTNGHIGIVAYYEINDRLLLRGSYIFARVNGDDALSEKAELRARNLRFESKISEFSIGGEYHLFSLYEKRYTPYVFAGLGLFHFDPYTHDTTGILYHLRPLSTEGQYTNSGKESYQLLQPVIPFGGGVKFAITENLRIGVEFGFRKIFTDYLDDVSTSYPDYNELLLTNGPIAVQLSYRGDELPGGDPAFPTKDTQRGGSAQKDIYYFTGLTITFRPSFGGGGSRNRSFGKKGKYGCPAVPL
jgi:hypothetical protein